METNDTCSSMLDVLLKNLERSRMKIHLYRIMYIGEHTLQFATAEEMFRNTVDDANIDTRDESLHGLLLHYSRCFLITLEGSEESILRHLTLLLPRTENFASNIRVLLMLRVNQRILATPWQALQLSSETGEGCDVQVGATLEPRGRGGSLEVWQEARVCVAKLHRLAGVLASRETRTGAPLSERSLLPEPTTLETLARGSLLLSVTHFLRRAVSPTPASRHDDHIWPPNDPL